MVIANILAPSQFAWTRIGDRESECGHGRFYDWRDGEPNDYDWGEDCAQLNIWGGGTSGTGTRAWNDVKCKYPLDYICGTRPCGVAGDNWEEIASRFRRMGWLRLLFALLFELPSISLFVVGILAMKNWMREDLTSSKTSVVGSPVALR